MSEPTLEILRDNEFLGKVVRDVWMDFAREQENPKASWLVPWEDLDEPMKDVDRRIGVTLVRLALIKLSGHIRKSGPLTSQEIVDSINGLLAVDGG